MNNKRFSFLEFLFYTVLIFFAILGIIYLVGGHFIEYQAPQKAPQKVLPILIIREITAYTASFDETDSTPCEGALPGIDFCNPPFPIVATNELPLGSKVKIDGVDYLVADRMNQKYQNTYDILMASKSEAFNFGRQIKPVIIY